MKNNKFILLIFILMCLSLFSAGTEVCFAENITGTSVIPLKQVLIKFCITMGSVLLSVIVIWVGLNIFRKNYPENPRQSEEQELYSDTFETPKTIDEAIISFIDKNKL